MSYAPCTVELFSPKKKSNLNDNGNFTELNYFILFIPNPQKLTKQFANKYMDNTKSK